MPIKHVILRANEAAAGAPRPRAGAATISHAPPATLEVDELTLRRASDLATKKGVRAVAPVMPMKLIAVDMASGHRNEYALDQMQAVRVGEMA